MVVIGHSSRIYAFAAWATFFWAGCLGQTANGFPAYALMYNGKQPEKVAEAEDLPVDQLWVRLGAVAHVAF